MRDIKRKIIFVIVIFLFCLCIKTNSYSKYVFFSNIDVANLKFDRTKPIISVVSIKNTNTKYPKYASKKHDIVLVVDVNEKNFDSSKLQLSKLLVTVGEKIVNPKVEVNKVEKNGDITRYELKVSNILEDGKLKFKFAEGFVLDNAGWKNVDYDYNTNIIIDNMAPKCNFEEIVISKGKSKGKITTDEQVQEIPDWNMDSNKMMFYKEFNKNVTKSVVVSDFAENETEVNVKISDVDYIDVTYVSHNSQIGWTYDYKNGLIAGKKLYKYGQTLRTEGLAFNVDTNLGNDFVQARAYIYTHWGENAKGKCESTGMIYNDGYNPSISGWKNMNSTDLVTHNGKKYFQFGGSCVNREFETDVNGNNPIPIPIASKNLYGICGITMSLKDYSEFSIIYQILVEEKGWLCPKSDGQEAMYAKNKAISSFRMTVVPKVQKQNVIDKWNSDVGTKNMND